MDAEGARQEQLYLEGAARRLSAVAPVPVSAAVVASVPGLEAEAILERAGAAGADLIVMSTHGRGPLGRLALGSVADEVVRRAFLPVLLVRPREPAPGPFVEPTAESVLIPLDGSALAERALGPAADLAWLLGARCDLVRVVAPGDGGPGQAAEEEAEARSYLGRVAGRLGQRGLQARTLVLAARQPAEAIVLEARARGSGLIALATHGRGGLRRALLGSVADKVLRAAPCPVLVYRPAGGAGA
jgi:nucleotide-binding universal stress UspA family protein